MHRQEFVTPSENIVTASENIVIPSAARDLISSPKIPRSLRSLGMTIVVSLAAGRLGAQTPATVDSGMTRTQVVAKLGEPLSVRSRGEFTYLLYKNGCEKTCGMNDLVVLDSGKVVDAIFRAAGRRYTGKSSSPRAIPRAEASKTKAVTPPPPTHPPAAGA